MQSRWVDRDAKAAVDRFAAVGILPELALRVYTTRLLGGDAALGISPTGMIRRRRRAGSGSGTAEISISV